jgi:hypothetical protein
LQLLLQEIRMSSNRRLKQSRTRDDEKGARTARSTGKRSKRAQAEELSPEQRVRGAP